MQKPHKANLLKKVLMLIVASSVFAFIGTSHGYAQTPVLNFSISPDTVYMGEKATITNNSSGWPAGSYFVWEFEYYYQGGHGSPSISLFDTTYSVNDSIVLQIDVLGKMPVILRVVDSNGIILGDTTKFVISVKWDCAINSDMCSSVYNGSFEIEDATQSYASWGPGILHRKSCNWPRPLQSNMNVWGVHPDYFSTSSTSPLVQIPNNWTGHQNPMTANENYYAGLLTYFEPEGVPVETREYMSQNILDIYGTPLIPGRKYLVGMYVSLSDNSKYASNIGMFLSDVIYYQSQYNSLGNNYASYFVDDPILTNPIAQLSPQVASITPITEKNDNIWVLVADTVIGNNQQQLIIGNFNDNANSSITPLYETPEPRFIDPSSGVWLTGSYYYIDHVFIEPAHYKQYDSICLGECVTLTSSSNDYLYIAGTGWIWNTIPQPSNLLQSITVCPKNDTLITCTVIDYTGCTIIDSFFIKVNLPPPLPIVIGNRNNCDTITTYQIENPQPNCSYLWGIHDTIPSHSSSFPTTGQQITVNWNQIWNMVYSSHGYVYMYILCMDNSTGCYSMDSIKIWNCCVYEQNGHINDDTITTNSIFTGPITVLNGTILVNANITVPTGAEILMAPEAKIIVNPPYTFTVNTRTIKAGCTFMWDGIYVTDSNAKVEIVNQCTVQDAYNAIVSENGGKYNLVYSNFYNNNISVLVKNYFRPSGIPALPAHKGFISKCRFEKNGAGMIAPYLNIKPTFGVYADNVYMLTIGDSMQPVNKNLFQNLYCGIAAFNSSVNVYNNEFINIKPASACAYDPGEFVKIQCETAVHSASTDVDIWHLNTSVLNIGGSATNANSGNIFNNVQTGIYTYKTKSRIRNNAISNSSSWAIFLRDFGHESFVKSNTTQTNTACGIKVMNTVPNAATGIKLDVNNNTIINPTYGIYISNVVSNPTNVNCQAKVINNMIWMNGTTTSPHYGCRFENSDYIEAYCNKVKRSSLTPVVDSLKVIGFRFENCLGGYIHDNQFSKLSLGIKTSGIIGSPAYANANFKVNNLDSCYHAFYFETAYGGNSTFLVNQGAAGAPTDNKFSNYPGRPDRFRFWGALPSIMFNWFFKALGNQYLVSIPFGHPLWNKIFPQPTTGTASTIRCSSVPSSMSMEAGLVVEPGNSEAQSLGVALGDNFSFGEIDAEMKYNLQDYAYSVLSNLEQQPTSTNSILLHQFSSEYLSLQEGNVGKFHQVLALIDSSAYEDALSLTASIIPSNQIELNKQYALNAYLEFVVPQIELPQSVVDALQQIANTPTCLGGEGVFIARAIVGYEEPVSVDQKSMQNVVNQNRTVLVFPNPTESEVNVLFEGFVDDQKVDFSVYNLMGRLVLSKQIATGANLVIVDVSSLSSGYYILMLKSSGQTIYNDRIVIIK